MTRTEIRDALHALRQDGGTATIGGVHITRESVDEVLLWVWGMPSGSLAWAVEEIHERHTAARVLATGAA